MPSAPEDTDDKIGLGCHECSVLADDFSDRDLWPVVLTEKGSRMNDLKDPCVNHLPSSVRRLLGFLKQKIDRSRHPVSFS